MFLSVSASPLLMLLVLVFLLCLVCLSLIFDFGGFFFSYLVFLLFMSGLIMLLMYFCSIILNEKFIVYFDLVMAGLFLAFFFKSDHSLFCDNIFGLFELKLSHGEFFGLVKYLIYSYSAYSLFFINYLLFCLVVVYEIVKKCSGPLRMKA